jgi:hypothetical protein
MNDGTCGRPGLRRMRSGLPAIVAGIALLTTACSGSPSGGSPGGVPAASGHPSRPPGSGGSRLALRPISRPRQLAYSECMRSHGVPGVPTSLPSPVPGKPPGEANFKPVTALGPGPGSPRWQAAQQACRALMPMPPMAPG